MSVEVREIGDADRPLAWEIGRRAFGNPAPMPAGWPHDVAGQGALGVFVDGRLAGRALVLAMAQYYGGRPVPMGGVAGVAVEPEHRSRGLALALMSAVVERMRAEGFAVSALTPATPALYRRCGYEFAGEYRAYTWPLAELRPRRGAPDGSGLTVSAVRDPAGWAEALAVYAAWAATGSGLLVRAPGSVADPLRGQVWPADDPRRQVLLARAGDRAVGYVRYRSGDATGRLEVAELVADPAQPTAPGALARLLGVLASWESMAADAAIRLADPNAVEGVLATAGRPCEGHAWMLSVLDPGAAVSARGWPPLRAAVELSLAGTGDRRLAVEDGEGRWEPARTAAPARPQLHPRGLAALYTGRARCAGLRLAGLMTGPREADPMLDLLTAGPPPAMVDSF